jgi:hypothetical protein
MLQLVVLVDVVEVASQGASLLAQNATVALVLQIVDALELFKLVGPTSLDKVLEALEEVLSADVLIIVGPTRELSVLEVFEPVAVAACSEALYAERMLMMPVIFQSSHAEGGGVCVTEMPVLFGQKNGEEVVLLRDDDVFEEDPVPVGLDPVVSAPEASEVELVLKELKVLDEFPAELDSDCEAADVVLPLTGPTS